MSDRRLPLGIGCCWRPSLLMLYRVRDRQVPFPAVRPIAQAWKGVSILPFLPVGACVVSLAGHTPGRQGLALQHKLPSSPLWQRVGGGPQDWRQQLP